MSKAGVRSDNVFTTGWLPGVFVRTALPIILIMSISGIYVVVDAWFLGVYAGPEALSAVTLIFPMMMLLLALQTLVSNGMASVLSRQLGAGDRDLAASTFSAAHVLAGCVVLVLYALFFTCGDWAIRAAAGSATGVAAKATAFINIAILFAPVSFVLSLNIDALRCEGRIGFMTAVTVSATLLNILFNWMFMGLLGWGVAGSAAGSA